MATYSKITAPIYNGLVATTYNPWATFPIVQVLNQIIIHPFRFRPNPSKGLNVIFQSTPSTSSTIWPICSPGNQPEHSVNQMICFTLHEDHHHDKWSPAPRFDPRTCGAGGGNRPPFAFCILIPHLGEQSSIKAK